MRASACLRSLISRMVVMRNVFPLLTMSLPTTSAAKRVPSARIRVASYGRSKPARMLFTTDSIDSGATKSILDRPISSLAGMRNMRAVASLQSTMTPFSMNTMPSLVASENFRRRSSLSRIACSAARCLVMLLMSTNAPSGAAPSPKCGISVTSIMPRVPLGNTSGRS